MELKTLEVLTDGEIDLVLNEKSDGDADKGFSPEYKFLIMLHNKNTVIGHIHLRIGETDKIMKYIGHIGYGVGEQFRGNHFAAKACFILKEVLKVNSMHRIIIICSPDNYASRRTCELIGARLIEMIDIPTESDVCSPNETQKCRYEWLL